MSTPSVRHRPDPVFMPPIEVFRADGPIVSVHLNTEGAIPDASERVELRWKSLRQGLVEDGAPEQALTAIDPLVAGSHVDGEALAVVASPGGVLYRASLPHLPAGDGSATVGALPALVPLYDATQRLLPHIVVATDRLGAEIVLVLPDEEDKHVEVEGKDLHVQRSHPGGWSQRRYQQRAENRWEANAREVADALTRLVDRSPARLVVVSGDVRAVQFLREQLPDRVLTLLTEVQGDYSGLDEAVSRAEQVVTDHAAAETEALLADVREQLGSNGLATLGGADTLAALSAGQVDTLLIEPGAAAGRTAWFGQEPTAVAADQQRLQLEVESRGTEAPLADVAVRAAVATSASVRIVPAGTTELGEQGVGALLRFR